MSQLQQNIKIEKDPTKLYFLLNELEFNLTKNYKRDSLLFFLNQVLMNVTYLIAFVNVYIFAVSQHPSEILSENIPIIKSIINFSPKFQAPFWVWLAIVCIIPPIITGIIKAITKVFARKTTVNQVDTDTKTATEVLLKLKEVRGLCFVDDRATPTVILGSLAIHFALAVLFLVYRSELYINAVLVFLLAMIFLSGAMVIINIFNISFSGAVPCLDSDLNKLITEFESYAKEEEQVRIAEEQAKKQAEEREEEKRKQKEKLRKAAELYAQATHGDETDMELLKQAADMGNPAACKEYGKMLFLETTSDLYTKAEKEDKCITAATYLVKVKGWDKEAEFLWLACRIRYESNDVDEWEEILDRVRAIKASGELSEVFADSIDLMIQLLVQTIDGMEVKQQTSQSRNGHYYCRFYNAGICNHQSNEYYIHKCTDPVNQSCTHALLNNGLRMKNINS